jgi:hypothetical protein
MDFRSEPGIDVNGRELRLKLNCAYPSTVAGILLQPLHILSSVALVAKLSEYALYAKVTITPCFVNL